MANFNEVVDHVTTWEGGHSADPRDEGLKFGHSGVLGKGYDNRFPNNYIHTNKGILWVTYVNYCQRKGIKPSPTQFINMNMTLWKDIAYSLYWKPYYLNDVNSQAIAQIIFEGMWGGGGSSLVRFMQRKLNALGYVGANGLPLVEDGAMGKNTVFALNNATKNYDNEIEIIKYMTDERLKYLQSLKSWSWAGKGWTNRVNDMLIKALKIAKSERIMSLIAMGGIFFLVYKGYQRYDKKVMWGGRI